MRGIVLFEYKSLIFHNFPPFLAHCAELPSSIREVLFSNRVCMQKYNYYFNVSSDKTSPTNLLI